MWAPGCPSRRHADRGQVLKSGGRSHQNQEGIPEAAVGEVFQEGPRRNWEVTRRPPQRQPQRRAPRVRFREEEGTEGFRDAPSLPTTYCGY